MFPSVKNTLLWIRYDQYKMLKTIISTRLWLSLWLFSAFRLNFGPCFNKHYFFVRNACGEYTFSLQSKPYIQVEVSLKLLWVLIDISSSQNKISHQNINVSDISCRTVILSGIFFKRQSWSIENPLFWLLVLSPYAWSMKWSGKMCLFTTLVCILLTITQQK